jgi:RNA polymerase sigma-70 factor (ECF subfamily)
LFALAYGMLGSDAEAEDVVQEAFARWPEADRSAVHSPAAFLTTVVTRLAIDRLRSAERKRRRGEDDRDVALVAPPLAQCSAAQR